MVGPPALNVLRWILEAVFGSRQHGEPSEFGELLAVHTRGLLDPLLL